MRLLKVSATSLLAVAAATTFAMPVQAASKDADRDGMSDSWELRHRLNPRSKADAKADPDGDRLNNIVEYQLGGNPRDEDTDNDGQDDGDERGTRTKVNKADSDGDRIADGDEDADRDGVANEDEDDSTEPCAGDDDDTDRDHVADEDESELGLRSNDADSDDDGTGDGTEDRDADGKANEDEDDNAADSCSGDRDGEDDEDKGDRFGTIASFDHATGALVVTTTAGYRLSAQVTEDTEIKTADERRGKHNDSNTMRTADADKDESGKDDDCDDADEREELKAADADKDESGKDDDCDDDKKDDDKKEQASTEVLVAGAVIKELEMHRRTGAVKEIKLTATR